jgi:tellurite resistance protein
MESNDILREIRIMKMETNAEAFACLAVMMAGADGHGSMEESEFIFDTMAEMPVFEGLDQAGLLMVLSEANRRVYSFAKADDGRVSDEGISTILTQVRDKLTPALRAEAVQMALDLARADDLSPEEEMLMARMRSALLPQA